MSGLGIRLYTDEDVDAHLAEQLLRLGYDVLSCSAAGNASKRLPDTWQLNFATEQGRAILIHNVADYVAIDRARQSRGQAHWGIIYVRWRTPIGELIRRTRVHLDTVSPEQQYNVLRYLADI